MKRILTNAGATLQATFYNDETTVDADGTVNVVITRGDGSVLVASTPASHVNPTGSGAYQYVLAPQAAVDSLTATWSGTFGGVARSIVTQTEVVGGTLFGLAEARASDSTLADANKYPTAALALARTEVEEEFERICGCAFFTRYRRVTVSGKGTSKVVLPDPFVTKVRSVTKVANDGTTTVFTSTELAGIRVSATGAIERVTGVFDQGRQNIVVEYEYGRASVDEDVRRVGFIRFRYRLNLSRSAIPDRATSYTEAGGGGTYRLDTPGPLSTGMPEVDAVLLRPDVNCRAPGIA